MNPDTVDLIRDLAAQLGSSGEQLIALYVPRVVAGAWFWLVAGALAGVAVGIGAFIWARLALEDNEPVPGFVISVLGFAACMFFLVVVGESFATLCAPKAAAVHSILRDLGELNGGCDGD